MQIWCGIDWSERHHDIALVDEDGVLVAKRRIAESAAGFRQLLELLAEHQQRSEAPILVAMETVKGLLPAALRAAGHQLFPINPLAVSRYRDRYVVSRAKSDPGDALVLANILRTDLAAHSPLPADSELVQAIAVLARARRTRSGHGPACTTSCARCCSDELCGVVRAGAERPRPAAQRQGHVADPVQPVLDRPVALDPGGEQGGLGLPAGRAGDCVDRGGVPAAGQRAASTGQARSPEPSAS